jgi:hypothetical protein
MATAFNCVAVGFGFYLSSLRKQGPRENSGFPLARE